MRKAVLIFTAITAISSAVLIACADSAAEVKKENVAMTQKEMVQRGSYLVNAMGCDDCHSPKKMTATGFEVIPELRLSGFNPEMASLKPGK